MRTLIALSVLAFASSANAAPPVHTNGQTTGVTAGCVESVEQRDGRTVVRGVGNCPYTGDVSSTNQSGGITAGSIGTVDQTETAPATPPQTSRPIRSPNTVRDCLNNRTMGAPPPRPTRADATYFYITTVMTENVDGRYGSSVGWAVKGSLIEACDSAKTDFHNDHPTDDGWSISGLTVEQVPDFILKQGLNH